MVTDSKRLQQVLKNLLSNAFKFTAEGGVRLTVSAAVGGWSAEHPILNHAPAVVAFEVTDTGIGIPLEKQKLIFEAFQQADAGTSRKYGGTGLGLAISRELASLLGGEIHLRSTPGKGSTFVLYLPLKYSGPTVAPRAPSPSPYAAAPALQAAATQERVIEQLPDDRLNLEPGDTILLIVEDDPHYARVLIDLARDKGFKVLVATRGAEALDLAKQFQPTAVSLDVFLPDMLGWTVLSQLKHNPLTRHIPVQIITLDEDRQHALARGAFSFVNKPTTTEGVSAALSQIKEYAKPRRKRLLIVEDNAAEQMSIRELLDHDDIEIVTSDTGAGALSTLRDNPCDCVVLDLRLPDMSGFEVLDRIRNDESLSNVPVVVFTGRELSAEEDAELHTMARSIVVKGVESPERLLDETSLFLHRVITELPVEKQRMLEKLNSSDEDLVGKTALLVDDDARNIFALSSVLERRGMKVLTATTGHEAIALVESNPKIAIVLMDIMMPQMDGYQTIGVIRQNPSFGRLPDHRADRQGDEGRPREMPRGRRFGLSGQARQHRAVAARHPHVATPLIGTKQMMDHEKVNILLVDDQPAKLLAYEVILKELGENLVVASSGREALEFLLKNDVAVILVDVCMPELDGFELAAMIREHPRFQKTAMIFISAIQVSDIDRLRGYEMGAVDYVPVPVVPEVLRAKIKVFAELYRKTRQLERLNAELEDRVRARTAELEESHARLLESEQRRSLAIAAGKMGSWDWDWVNGDWMWDEGQYQIFGVDPRTFEVTPANIQALLHPDDIDELRKAMAQFAKGVEILRSGIPDHAARRRGALVRRHGGGDHRQGRPRRPRQRRHRRHHRAQAGRRASEPAGAGSRSPRQERAGAGAIHRPADARRKRQDLRPLGRGTDQRAGAGAYRAVAVELAGRRNRQADRRGARALFERRSDRAERSGSPVAASDRADGGAGAARARHQFGQVWRAVDAGGPALGELGEPGRRSQDGMGGDRRTSGREADVARLRDKKRDRQHRVAARRTGRIRLAPRRPDLPPLGSVGATPARPRYGFAPRDHSRRQWPSTRGAIGPADCRDDPFGALQLKHLPRLLYPWASPNQMRPDGPPP